MSKLKLGKVSLNFKTPDAAARAAAEAVQEIMLNRAELSEDEEEDVAEDANAYDYFHDQVMQAIGKFVKYGECIRVEIDLDNGTATVLPVKS